MLWETPTPNRSHQGHVSCFPLPKISAMGNTQPHQSPSGPRLLFPTGRNWGHGKHPTLAEPFRAISLFPTASNNRSSDTTMGTGTPLCPRRLVFFAARGARPLLRPRQLLFFAARGAMTLLRPGQLLFFATKGARTLLRPGQLLFFATKGAKTLFRPRQLFFFATRGAGDSLSPW